VAYNLDRDQSAPPRPLMGYADTSHALRDAFEKNPYMRLFVASGHFDLATPYAATDYTVSHMALAPAQRARIQMKEYEAGQMMYIDQASLVRLYADVSAFLEAGR
jgi:carboxypeptidase C (cathepsin A)